MTGVMIPLHAPTHLPGGSDPLPTGGSDITSDDGTVIITGPTGPITDLSVTVPNAVVAGSTLAFNVPTGTLTTFNKFLVGSTSSNNTSGWFSLPSSAGHITGIQINQPGFYMCQGWVQWGSPGSYLAAIQIKGNPAADVDFFGRGSIDGGATRSTDTMVASQTDPATDRQAFALLNFVTTSMPSLVQIYAYQTSGSTQQLSTAALTIFRMGDNGLKDYD